MRTKRDGRPRGESGQPPIRLLLYVVGLTLVALACGCEVSSTANLLNVIDVAPRAIEVGDTVEVLGSNLPSGTVKHARVIFEGELFRPGESPTKVSCRPGSKCIRVEGAKPTPDKVFFTFSEGLQTQFCGAGDAAAHTTFRGDVVVEFPPSVEGGHTVRGKVIDVVLDFRPPSTRRVVMEARTEQGRETLKQLGITIDPDSTVGLRVAAIDPGSAASDGGIAPGDVIVSFDGVKVASVADIAPRSGERLAEVSLEREGAPLLRTVSVASLHVGGMSSGLLAALLVLAIAAGVLLIFMAPTAGIITWVERRVSARMQSRVGPNRAGPQGFFIWVADGVKSISKEDIIPTQADQALFRLAPYLVFIGVSATFVVMPFGQYLIAADLDIGILFVIAVTSLAAIGLLTGGWASNNKWSLLGGIRAAAQVISYEIPSAVAIVCIVMMTGSLSMQEIIGAQAGLGNSLQGMQGAVDLLTTGGWPWYWYAFRNPVTFLLFFLFFTTALAEGNRTPFDLPEGESELVAGYSTEYSGMRYVFFFFAEWANIFVFCGIATALFLGGWQVPGVSAAQQEASLGLQLLGTFLFLLKAWVLIFIVIWIRWTLPRIRIDQLMTLCWKWLVPLSFLGFALTGLWVMGTSNTAQRGEGGMLEAVPALINQQIQLGVSLLTFALWLLLLVHFFRRVHYNFKASKMPLHLNPFI